MSKDMFNSGIEWIGSVPKSWKLERLQWYLEEVKESNDPIKTTQVLSLTNKLGVIPYEEKGEQGNKSKENLNEYKLAYPNTIVANSMNILIGSVGLSNYYGCVSPVYYVYKAKENANIEFLNFLFQTREFQKELRKYANGILEIRLRVSSSNILKRFVAIPPKEIQDKIVKCLNDKISKIDLLLSNQEKQIKKLEEYKQILISEILKGGIYNNKENIETNNEIIGRIPIDWNLRRLKTLTKIISKGATPDDMSLTKDDYYNIRFLKAENIVNGVVVNNTEYFIDEKTHNQMKRSHLMENDILFVIAGATIGKTAILQKEMLPANTNQAISFIRLEKKYIYLVEYIKLLLESNITKDVIKRNSVQSAQPNISMEDLGNIYLPIPKSQNEITEILLKINNIKDSVDKLIKIKQEKIEKLNEYKKTLIYEYVTGKKEV